MGAKRKWLASVDGPVDRADKAQINPILSFTTVRHCRMTLRASLHHYPLISFIQAIEEENFACVSSLHAKKRAAGPIYRGGFTVKMDLKCDGHSTLHPSSICLKL